MVYTPGFRTSPPLDFDLYRERVIDFTGKPSDPRSAYYNIIIINYYYCFFVTSRVPASFFNAFFYHFAATAGSVGGRLYRNRPRSSTCTYDNIVRNLSDIDTHMIYCYFDSRREAKFFHHNYSPAVSGRLCAPFRSSVISRPSQSMFYDFMFL